ncbi:hypothetical protein GC093_31910 [Paenibacillus sp. LMG 31456]|uniref:Uncharacterized protein n=1 Tax=Paenibacillus foliorum TaxID=2654974 RepID=A0A972H1N0_9BACL|nr:hypothetical protein [Paenibacillus foliorum]
MNKPNMKLRVAWIIPNIFMYIFFIGISVFVLNNSNGLQHINQLVIWVVILILLLFTALFGTFRILSWIKQGKL